MQIKMLKTISGSNNGIHIIEFIEDKIYTVGEEISEFLADAWLKAKHCIEVKSEEAEKALAEVAKKAKELEAKKAEAIEAGIEVKAEDTLEVIQANIDAKIAADKAAKEFEALKETAKNVDVNVEEADTKETLQVKVDEAINKIKESVKVILANNPITDEMIAELKAIGTKLGFKQFEKFVNPEIIVKNIKAVLGLEE